MTARMRWSCDRARPPSSVNKLVSETFLEALCDVEMTLTYQTTR